MKKEDKSNDAKEEIEPYIVESFPKSFQAGWGIAEGLVRRGILSNRMMWVLILAIALHALPNNSPVSFNFHFHTSAAEDGDTTKVRGDKVYNGGERELPIPND